MENSATNSFLRFEHIYFSWQFFRSYKKYTVLKNIRTNTKNIYIPHQSISSLLLNDISMDIAQHECIGIQGSTGVGKSTLAKLLTGLISPISGTIYFKNEKQDYASYKKRMYLQYQMVYQQPLTSFNPRISIYQSMYDALSAYKKTFRTQLIHANKNDIKKDLSKKQQREAFHHELFYLLQKINIQSTLLHRLPHQVSGGELQRLSLARVFIVKPKLIILDEPVSFLDNILRKQILDVLLSLFSYYKSSVVLISHLEEVLRYTCSSIYSLSEGNLHKIY